jgi:CubicO group peptidase (beta-lactamase class C family)
VLHHGRIVFERYDNGFDADSKQQSWSMAKSVLSTLYGVALARGQVESLDDPLTKYVPELKGNGFDGVTIEQALSMSTGVDWDEQGPQREELIRNAVINHLTFGASGEPIDQATADPVLKRVAPPGQTYDYASINSQALGWALERATGKRFHELLEQWIWRPVGMTTTAEVMNDGSGNDFTFCCIHATARDYARFGWLLANGGRANGRQLIPRAWVKRSTSVERFKTDDGYGYALHWRTPHDKAGDFAAAGYAGQMIYVSPRNRTVVVRLARDKETRPFETFTLSRAIGERLAHPGRHSR